MSGVGPRSSYSNLFRKLNILPVAYQYILSLILLMYIKVFITNAYFHSLDTRNENNLYFPFFTFILSSEGSFILWGSNSLINFEAIWRLITMAGKVSKTSYTCALLLIPFIQLLNFYNAR